MSISKEIISQQVAECRRRLQLLVHLRNDAATAVDKACSSVNDDIAEATRMSEITSDTNVSSMITKMENAIAVLKECQKGMEGIRSMHESVEGKLTESTERLDRILYPQLTQSGDQALPYEPRCDKITSSDSTQSSTSASEITLILENGIPAESGTSETDFTASAHTGLQNGHQIEPGKGQEKGDVSEAVNDCIEEDAQEMVTIVNHQTATIDGNDAVMSSTVVAVRSPDSDGDAGGDTVLKPSSCNSVEKTIPATEQNGYHNGDCASSSEATGNLPTDYRMRVVCMGDGKPTDFCQRSLSLNKSSTVRPLQCVVSHVESPSLFWIQLSTFNMLDEIEDDLNKKLEDDPLPCIDPKVGDYCAAPIGSDSDLHRAKILEIKSNKSSVPFAKVLYIDSGKVDWVATKALLGLPSVFRQRPRQAYPCALAQVEPVSGVWDDDAIAVFRELCASDDGAANLAVKCLDEEECQDIYTVSLYRINKTTSAQEKSVAMPFIAKAAPRLRFADLLVPMKGFEKEDGVPIGGQNPPDDVDGWRCEVRAIEIPTPPAATASASTTALVENHSGDHKRSTSRSTCRTTRKRPIIQGVVHDVPLSRRMPSSDGDIHFVVTLANSPSEFYIQLRDQSNGNDDLDLLTEDMNIFYNNPANRMLLSRSTPQYAVVQWPVNDMVAYRRVYVTDWQSNQQPLFQTRDIRVNSTATALFIDEGFSVRLQTKDLSILDRRFCALPAQAARCKLHDCHPAWSEEWNGNSVDIFQGLCVCRRALMRGLLMSECKYVARWQLDQ